MPLPQGGGDSTSPAPTPTNSPTPGAAPVGSGVLVPGAEIVAELVSQGTGLDLNVVRAWIAHESAYGRSPSAAYNYLNLKNVGGGWRAFRSPQDAGAAYVAQLHASFYGGILQAAGQSPSQQITAIAASPWDAGHYGGAGGPNLVATYNSINGQAPLAQPGDIPASQPAAPPTTFVPGPGSYANDAARLQALVDQGNTRYRQLEQDINTQKAAGASSATLAALEKTAALAKQEVATNVQRLQQARAQGGTPAPAGNPSGTGTPSAPTVPGSPAGSQPFLGQPLGGSGSNATHPFGMGAAVDKALGLTGQSDPTVNVMKQAVDTRLTGYLGVNSPDVSALAQNRIAQMHTNAQELL